MQNILEVFWTNVEWHMKNKNVSWTTIANGNIKSAKTHKYNPTLKRVMAIAKKLDIDDYSILFEEI